MHGCGRFCSGARKTREQVEDWKMTTSWKFAAVMIAALTLASCSGTNYQTASGDQVGYGPAGADTNWIGAAVLLALLVVYSTSN
jgi:hypothetical protein